MIYRSVMRCLVRRYVTSQQLKAEETGVTEDDVNEVKQAVTSFRSELFDILRNNGMKGVVAASETLSRKERLRERRLLKDFNIDLVESVMEAFMKDGDKKQRFSIMRRLTTGKREKAKKNWNALAGAARSRQNHIGSGSSHGGSLKELREKVLQEQELPPMRGVRRFAHAARRVLHDENFRSTRISEYDNANNISAIEEEVPGTFSANATPRNSMAQDALTDETKDLPKEEASKTLKVPEDTSKSPKATEDTSKSPKTTGDTNKSPKATGDTSKQKDRRDSAVVVNIEKDEPSPRSKRLDSYPPGNASESRPKDSKSNVKGLISQFDDGTGEKKEDEESESRRHSEPNVGDKKTDDLQKRRNAKIFPVDENVGWL